MSHYDDCYAAEQRDRDLKRRDKSINAYEEFKEQIELIDYFVTTQHENEDMKRTYSDFKNAVIAWRFKTGQIK